MSPSSITTAEDRRTDQVEKDESLPSLAEWLDPSRCALITIDVQNDFCHPTGAVAQMGNDVSAILQMMPALHRMVALARSVDVPIIHVRTGLSDWFDTPAWRARGRLGRNFDPEGVPVVREGTWGSEFFQLEPEPEDLVITKYRYSAFTYTPLELALRSRFAETLVLTGTATHQCVEATGREAIGLGFYPVVVSEAVASRDTRRHDQALEDFPAHLGAVTTIDQLMATWQADRWSRARNVTGR
jgi:ureidoacrylate peracid hydrolase